MSDYTRDKTTGRYWLYDANLECKECGCLVGGVEIPFALEDAIYQRGREDAAKDALDWIRDNWGSDPTDTDLFAAARGGEQ